MMFVTVSDSQAAIYKYICAHLNTMINKMSSARHVFENVAHTSFDKPFSKCMYLLASESLQCENEMRSHVGCLNCNSFDQKADEQKVNLLSQEEDPASICRYLEDIYLNSYKKLLNDKHLGSVKDMIQNHLQLFMSSLTQLRLFNELQPMAN